MNKITLNQLKPIIFNFLIINALLFLFKNKFEEWGFDVNVLILGNIILFLLIAFSFLLVKKTLFSSNQQAFSRALFGGFILKFFAIAIAAFVYIQLSGEALNKQALLAVLGLYIVYTVVEVGALTKLLKQNKNG